MHASFVLTLAAVLSGAAALTYETLWTRAFGIIMGSTVQAASVTFAAFLVGLSLGAWWLGARVERVKDHLRAYIVLEVAIAIVAAGVGLLLHHGADTLAVYLGTWVTSVPVIFTLALVLVIVPTFLMGGTLPLILVLARDSGLQKSSIGRLYGFNTFGAAIGTIVTGFFLIRLNGISSAYLVGAGCNIAVALLCLNLVQPKERRTAFQDDAEAASAEEQPVSDRLLLWIAGLSGFLVLAMEIVWSRLASFFIGNRIYAITTLLASVLVLLSIGAWLAAWIYRRYGHVAPGRVIGWLLIVAALAIGGSTLAVESWIHHQEEIEAAWPFFSQFSIIYRFLEAFIFLALVVIPLGALFPLTLTLTRRSTNKVGEAAGQFYLSNTMGAVLGSLSVAFAGFFWLGTYNTAKLLAGIALVCAFLLLYTQRGASLNGRQRWAPVMAGGVVLMCLVFIPGTLSAPHSGDELVYRVEDEYGVFQVIEQENGLKKVINSRTELVYLLGSQLTSYVQQIQGHLGMFYKPDAKKALVLGSGYGITAGALGSYPTLDRVDAVEIIPGMIAAADLFSPFNLDYHKNPRVHIYQDDGRHFLARAQEAYDIISVNVSDPHLPGGSTLFHTEFYDLVKQKLAPRGVVIQHAFGSDVDTVLATLAESFPYLVLYPAYANGYNVVAMVEPPNFDAMQVEQLMRYPSVVQALAGIGLVDPLRPSGVFRQGLLPQDIPSHFRNGQVATDDRPRIEFAWHTMGEGLLFSNE